MREMKKKEAKAQRQSHGSVAQVRRPTAKWPFQLFHDKKKQIKEGEGKKKKKAKIYFKKKQLAKQTGRIERKKGRKRQQREEVDQVHVYKNTRKDVNGCCAIKTEKKTREKKGCSGSLCLLIFFPLSWGKRARNGNERKCERKEQKWGVYSHTDDYSCRATFFNSSKKKKTETPEDNVQLFRFVILSPLLLTASSLQLQSRFSFFFLCLCIHLPFSIYHFLLKRIYIYIYPIDSFSLSRYLIIFHDVEMYMQWIEKKSAYCRQSFQNQFYFSFFFQLREEWVESYPNSNYIINKTDLRRNSKKNSFASVSFWFQTK